jgi:gas vesicle protein
MVRRKQGSQVVYLERSGDSSAKWLFYGAVLGAGLALLYAPRSGEETRRLLQRRMWKLRAVTEEKFDELAQQLGGVREGFHEFDDDEELLEDEGPELHSSPRAGAASAREELERRLAEARARLRASGELEEPLA